LVSERRILLAMLHVDTLPRRPSAREDRSSLAEAVRLRQEPLNLAQQGQPSSGSLEPLGQPHREADPARPPLKK
jgi:hypothetical protein